MVNVESITNQNENVTKEMEVGDEFTYTTEKSINNWKAKYKIPKEAFYETFGGYYIEFPFTHLSETSNGGFEPKDVPAYVVLCTQKGIIKRTDISEFENIRTNGKIAITLKEDDELISAKITEGNAEILIASSNGRIIRFNEQEIRIMGRTASGVRGIDVGDGVAVGMEITAESEDVLVVTENGYGKKTNIDQYRMTHRGSKGVKALNVTEKNGNIKIGLKWAILRQFCLFLNTYRVFSKNLE